MESESVKSERFHYLRVRLGFHRLQSSENQIVGVVSKSKEKTLCHWFSYYPSACDLDNLVFN